MCQKKAKIVPGMTGLPSPWQVVRHFVGRILRWLDRIYKERCRKLLDQSQNLRPW